MREPYHARRSRDYPSRSASFRRVVRRRVPIPQRLRSKFGLLPNTEVNFEEGDGGVVIRPVLSKRELVAERLRRARGAAGGDLGTDDVMRLTRGDE